MWLRKITLFNFGSYESLNSMELDPEKGRNIILIGGKNGAGKTTLFTAIKLCLYGHWEAGYKTTNAFYRKRVRQMINEKAKRERGAFSYVEIEFEIVNGNQKEQYSVKRQWSMDDTEFENVIVKKNGVTLNEEEENDFNNFLLMTIPPNLLNLYFFDGEQIANYFLEEGGTARTKDAVLTLCGYDTFEIMLRNFRRINHKGTKEDHSLEDYLACLDRKKEIDKKLVIIDNDIREKTDKLELIESEIQECKRLFTSAGGISYAGLEDMRVEVRYQERIRDDINSEIKKIANDEIPFMMLRKQLEGLRQQILKEQEYQKNLILRDSIQDIVTDALNDCCLDTINKVQIIKQIQRKIGDNIKNLHVEERLRLSQIEAKELLFQVENGLDLNKQRVYDLRDRLKIVNHSIKKLKDGMEMLSTEHYDDYSQNKITMERQSEELEHKLNMIIDEREKMIAEKADNESRLKNAERQLDDRYKKESIHELSARSILCLESLQHKLLKVELEALNQLLLQKLHDLMRKANFIEAVEMDDKFNLHIFRKEYVSYSSLLEQIQDLGIQKYITVFGHYHCNALLKSVRCQSMETFLKKSGNKNVNDQIGVLYEIDKSTLSMGEKQVLIMALYWSITQLCKSDIPFIIDTPFARIDSEHRANISEHFFKDLKGQVFILSTNEEIEDSHIEILKDKLLAFYLLENVENQKTQIVKNHYFGDNL